MAFDDRGVFELSWKNPSNQKLSNTNQISDYTIFWCENDKDRPYQCNVRITILRKISRPAKFVLMFNDIVTGLHELGAHTEFRILLQRVVSRPYENFSIRNKCQQ